MSRSRNFSSPSLYPSSPKPRIGCLHCPFQSNDTSELMSHEKACYSSLNERAILSKQAAKKSHKPKQLNMVQTIFYEDLGEVQFQIVKMEESDELVNGSPSNEDSELVSIESEKHGDYPRKCICGRHQYGFRTQCYQCEDWFHGSCVGITAATRKHLEMEGSEWFCPRCSLKESPMVHKGKLIQAVNYLTKMFPPVPKPVDLVDELITPSSQSPRDSTPPPDLEEDHYDLPFQEENQMSLGTEPPSLTFTRPSLPPSTEEEEEALCRAELDRMAQEIQAAQAVLQSAKKSRDEKVGMMIKTDLEEASVIAFQIKTLEEEQRGRIANFSLLEMKLFQISCGHVFDDIRRKEEEWMKAFGDSDV